MNYTTEISYIGVAYLVGSIPTGYLLTKVSTGKNIMEHGSKSVGSTNVKRIAGKRIALYTQLLDMLKGLLPVALFLLFFSNTSSSEYLVYAIALAAIIGHDFSIFLMLKGGKGVNTTLGASLLLAPVAVLGAVAVYFIAKGRFKFVSIGSMALSVALPTIEFIQNGFSPTCYYLMVCMALTIVLHWKNIVRLIKGEELASE